MCHLAVVVLAFWLSFSLLNQALASQSVTILRVVDGDTIVVEAPYLPYPLRPELAVRLLGVDTPEKNHLAQCDEEREKGEAASLFTKQLVARSTDHQVSFLKWDKYGGRVLGEIFLDGVSLRKSLLEAGHARVYYGEKKTLSWC